MLLCATALLLTVVWSSDALAKERSAIIKASTEKLDLGGFVYTTVDEMGEFSAQDVVQRFRNNIRGQRNETDLVQLPFSAHPYWLAFSVKNNTKNMDWVLDFGSLYEGQIGNASKLLVYEGRSRKIFFNGLNRNSGDDSKNIRSSAVPVSLNKDTESILVVYVVPNENSPLVLKPSLVRSDVYLNMEQDNDGFYKSLIYILVFISAVLLVFGYVYTHSPGFIPIAVYYGITFLWLYHFEWSFFAPYSDLGALPSSFFLVQSILVALSCFLTIPTKNESSNFRFMTISAIAVAIFVLVMLFTVLPLNSAEKIIVTFSVGVFSVVIGLFYIHVNKTSYTALPSLFLTVWIGVFLVGNAMRLLCVEEVLPHHWLITQAPSIALIPQTVLVFIGVLHSIDSESKRQVSQIVKKAQKAQTLLKAKQSKEASDQSRLLRVIEREREIMEELRGREAERSEEMRKAKVAADEANNSKSAFLAVVSHEIRTPMTGIMGMLRLLEDTNLSIVQKDYARTIKDSGDAMLALLNDILDFSKIQGGGMTLETINFDLKRVMNGVQMLMKGHADQKNLELKLEFDETIPETLLGDPTRIRQIFLNLVGNALKFTSKGHVKITVRTDKDHGKHDPGSGDYALYFAVEDTGIGISEEAQKNLFQPFAQADSSIARKYGGTGLGLSICKKLVEAMGSQIQIYSREGHGTRFYFTAVMKVSGEGALVSDEREVQSRAQIVPQRILVVDDNAINRKVVCGLLSRDGHQFETTAMGQETLDVLNKDQNFDIVLLDIELPDMSGVEVAQRMKENDSLAAIPLVALTGNVSDDDIAHYKDNGFIDHVAKPIDPDHLRLVLGRVQSGEIDTPEGDDDSFSEALAVIDEQEQKQETQKSTVPLLDENMLKGLKDGLGAPQTKELVEGLFEKTEEIIPLMEAAFENGDKDTLRARAHELKGMAGNFGLSGLSEKAATIERLCKSEETDIQDTKEFIELLGSTAERSRAAVDKFLES